MSTNDTNEAPGATALTTSSTSEDPGAGDGTPPVPIVGAPLWKLCNDMAWFPYIQSRAQDPGGRQTLMDEYSVPVGTSRYPTTGYWMVNYEQGHATNVVIAWVREALATLTGPQDFQGTIDGAPLDKLQPTNIFGFLYQLSQDARLWESYHNSEARPELLEEFFGSMIFPNVVRSQQFDHYGETQSLQTLVTEGDAEPLKETLAKISLTYQEFIGWT